MSAHDMNLGGIGVIPQAESAKRAIARWNELKQDRFTDEEDWKEIARFIRPQRSSLGRTGNEGAAEKPLSSMPIVAQSNLAAGLYGTLTNPANAWMGLKVNDPDLNDYQPVREWRDRVTNRVLASFQPSVSPFYDQTIQLFADEVAFGNGVQYDEPLAAERKIMDLTLSLAEVVWDIDAFGRVVEVVRRFTLKPLAALSRYGTSNLPPKVEALSKTSANEQIVFFQHVFPNEDFRDGYLGPKGKKFVSVTACEIESSQIRVGGYHDMPFDIPRWEVDSGRSIGRGPGWIALASTRAHHMMDAATLRAAQFAADPVKLTGSREDWPMHGVVRPGALIQGGLNMRGEAGMKTLDVSSQIPLTLQEKQNKQEEIKDAFNWSLMNLQGRTGMTATEVMTITEERQRLMAPYLGRIQTEFLRPKIERRVKMLMRLGQLPPLPKELEGKSLEVEYTSAAALAQQSQQGAAVMRIIEDLSGVAMMGPEIQARVASRLNPDGIVDALATARGAPAGMFRSKDEADAIAAQKAEAEKAMMQMQQMQQGAALAKDVAGAANLAGMTADPAAAAAMAGPAA